MKNTNSHILPLLLWGKGRSGQPAGLQRMVAFAWLFLMASSLSAQWEILDPHKAHYFLGNQDSASVELDWRGKEAAQVDSARCSAKSVWLRKNYHLIIKFPLQEKLEGYTEDILIWRAGQRMPDTVSVPIHVEYGTILLFDSTRYHLGIIENGKDLQYKIPFKNVGLYPAKASVRNSGGSSYGIIKVEAIPPGGEGVIDVTYGWRGNGWSRKTMRVGYNGRQPIHISYDYYSWPYVGPNDSFPSTKLLFDATVIDFGTVRQGDSLELVYSFTNSGNAPLLLESTTPTSGAAVAKAIAKSPNWTILPQERGEVRVMVDTRGKVGMISGTVEVVYNGNPKVITLSYKGNIRGQ